MIKHYAHLFEELRQESPFTPCMEISISYAKTFICRISKDFRQRRQVTIHLVAGFLFMTHLRNDILCREFSHASRLPFRAALEWVLLTHPDQNLRAFGEGKVVGKHQVKSTAEFWSGLRSCSFCTLDTIRLQD